MGNRCRSQGVRVKYAFIKAHRREFDTAVMCRLLDVSRSGFYDWLRNPLSDRALEDQRLLGLIRAAYTASHGVYGAPRIFLDLREAGETCSKHRVARIMRANNIKALHGYRAPRYTRGHTALLTPNTLQRGFTVQRPNTAWVTDITYVRTWEGWLYLAVVIDLYSRRIVGWSTKPTMARELVLDAILMAVRRRKPRHALIHSDQGSQFGSDAWRRFCHAHHLEPSMSRRGNCWDNAVAESFFSSLKKERIKKRIYKTREMANAEIYDYIEMFYNRTRRHSHLSGVSPEAFEAVSTRA
ncbi:MAG: transposase [Nitrospirae bacterium RIFCSPLOWO2_02_FULL_62_14]|nr:MAG: transposase [Nitrospirae bacterium RIFCSPLOWO2_02_FULL_62_14]OGW68414.1 MAG: transposase [Nitrospirae bacterium RIFCSPLOWO2_01_FULL_62_17]